MSCFYEHGNQKLDTRDLLKLFYQNNLTIKDSSIFSSEELQKNTYDKLKDLNKETSYNSSENPVISKFITGENYLFQNIKGLENQTRLVPEYILEKRVGQYVKDNILNAQYSYSESNEDINSLYNKIIESFQELEQEDKNKVKYLINELLQDIKLEDINKEFGSKLHTLISYKINNQEESYNNKLNEILNDEQFKPLFEKASSEQWKNQINNIVNSIIKTVEDTGSSISNLHIVYNDINNDNQKFAFKGKLDLVAIDSSGNPHIFEVKVSKNSYTNNKWDQSKLLSLDYELAFYKQLLGQYTDVSKTELYVLPITLGSTPETLKFEGLHNRNVESKSGLRQGRIETIVNSIIPLKIHPEYNPTRSNEFRGKLEKLLWEGYEPKLKAATISLENKLKRIEADQKRKGGKFTFYNPYSEIIGLNKGLIEADTLEEITPMVKLYLNHEEKNKNKKVVDLKSSISDSIRNKSRISTNNEEYDEKVNRLLLQYLNENWEVVNDFEETDSLGLILLRNKNDGQINVISISANAFLADSKIDGYSEGDIEYMKVFMFLNEYKKDLLPYNTNKFGDIILFNPENQKSYTKTPQNIYKKFVNLMSKQGFKSNDIKINLDNNFISLLDLSVQFLDNFHNSIGEELGETASKTIGDIILKLNTQDNLNLDSIKEAIEEFGNQFPEYKNKTYKSELNFDDKKEVIWAMLNCALATAYRADFGADFQNISNPGANFSDFRDLLSAFWTDKHPNYDKEGRRITGVLQGLLFQTPDWTPSKDVRNINELISNANSRIRELDVKGSEKISKITNKYYDDINFSNTSRLLIGKTQDKYENLWLKTNNDTISSEFKTKNPYKDDLENSLETPEKEFLKKMLFEINIYKLNINEKEVKNLNPMDLNSLMKNDVIAKAIEDGRYFEMPLIKREDLSRSKTKQKLSTYVDDVTQLMDHGMTAEDVKNFEDSGDGMYEMYDIYASHTPEYKINAINKYGVDYFELNLDTIAHRIMFNKTRKSVFDNVFPIITGYVWWIKMSGGKSNDDISNTIEHIKNQIKLAAFGQHIIDKDFKDIVSAQTIVKKVTTPLMLGLKPASMVKELTIGTWKGISLAATQLYGKDQFTVGDLTKAYSKLLTIDNKFSNEFNLIDRINQFYGFANMDANTLAHKLQTDRHGAFRFMSRYMYAANTIPDYYNRLSLFLAKMIHDGSYEAHFIENGEFTYNPKLDKRFSYYLENRNKYQDSKGNYIPAKNDIKYNEQRRHYLLVMDQINKESSISGESYTESDLLPKAYSEKERNSFKTLTDMSYGYYDKDSQDQLSNTWYGYTWMQFMQYWPGKMKMWFMKPTSKTGEDSAMGSIRQRETIDDNGNKVLWYRETYQKEDGTYDVRETTEDTGDPLLEWTGTPFEGLAYSCMSTLRDLVKLDFTAIKNDKQRLGRVMFALNDAMLMYLMFMFFSMIFKGLKEDNPDGLSNSVLSFGENVSKKITNEQNFYDSTLGALRSDPAWLSWGKKFATNMNSVMSGNKTILDAAGRSVGALEMFKEDKQ